MRELDLWNFFNESLSELDLLTVQLIDCSSYCVYEFDFAPLCSSLVFKKWAVEASS